ncbi:MAG TPA: PDZ domain-containing protein, partial [Pyrinomonadaceae bacterium]|nr:PDZ domain-containing protein [Pyrinomonadaceae bacterium]
MKRLRTVFLLSLSLLPFAFLLLPPFPSQAARNDAREARLAVFDDAWETVRDRYYDPGFHGLDWQQEREKFRPLAAEARDTAELYGVLRRLLSTLRDAHTRVYAPDERFDWRHPRFLSVGISVREVGGAPVVVSVERNSEAERAGLRAGDVVTSIDSEPALALFARRLKEQAASSTLAATRLQVMS